MVDFTKSISNEQMTIGLKRLLAMNTKLAEHCANLADEQSDSQVRDQLASLAEMHERHTKALSDSLLYLGAAPDKYKRANRRTRFPGADRLKSLFDGGGVQGLRHQEEKLRQACLEELEELKASDEVVNAVNELLRETEEAVHTLDR